MARGEAGLTGTDRLLSPSVLLVLQAESVEARFTERAAVLAARRVENWWADGGRRA